MLAEIDAAHRRRAGGAARRARPRGRTSYLPGHRRRARFTGEDLDVLAGRKAMPAPGVRVIAVLADRRTAGASWSIVAFWPRTRAAVPRAAA